MKISRWLYASLVLLFTILIGPFLIIFLASFGDQNNLAFPPQGFSLRWFVFIFENSQFGSSFWISLQIAMLGTIIALILGIPVAYALVRFRFRGKGLIETIFSSPILVPGMVVGYAMLRFFVLVGDLNIYMGLLIGHTAVLFPYSVRVVSASLRNLDPAIDEAAISLGASRLRSFFLVVLPNVQTGIVAAFILAFIFSFNNIPVSLFLTGPGVTTLPMEMLIYMEYYFDPSIAALSTLLIIFSIFLVQTAERTLGLSKFM